MDTKLSISDLAEVLAALKEVTKPYKLGIQLKIDSSTLKTIEKNHRGDIDRQKTEVIEYWLHNSPDASWTTLANAVERMGGHSKLVGRLRGYPEEDDSPSLTISRRSSIEYELQQHQSDHFTSFYIPGDEPTTTTLVEEPAHVSRNILILGKREHGKSTLGNRLLNSDTYFKINDQLSQTRSGSAILDSASSKKTYRINIFDHNGLFEGFSSINTLSSDLSRELHLVIVVLKYGRNLDENEQKILKGVMSEWQISGISALVLTHCEHLISAKERREMIEQFKKDNPSIAKLMGKGILAVGFPDSSHVLWRPHLTRKMALRRLQLS